MKIKIHNSFWILPVGTFCFYFLACGYLRYAIDGAFALESFLLYLMSALVLNISVFLHEMGHVIPCLLYGLKVKTLTLGLYGGNIEGDIKVTLRQLFFIAVGGPLVNLVLAITSVVLLVMNISDVGLFNLFNLYAVANGYIFITALTSGKDGSLLKKIITNDTEGLKKEESQP